MYFAKRAQRTVNQQKNIFIIEWDRMAKIRILASYMQLETQAGSNS